MLMGLLIDWAGSIRLLLLLLLLLRAASSSGGSRLRAKATATARVWARVCRQRASISPGWCCATGRRTAHRGPRSGLRLLLLVGLLRHAAAPRLLLLLLLLGRVAGSSIRRGVAPWPLLLGLCVHAPIAVRLLCLL
jgi:hypothetical protein